VDEMLENPKAPLHDLSKLGLVMEPVRFGACDQCGTYGQLHVFAVRNNKTGEHSRIKGAFCSVFCMMAAWE
jgi:hypothetical protein